MARILHIEDNHENLMLVRRLLEAGGHSVIEAEDAFSGISKLSETRPDLVLMDINLPGLDGSEAATIIRGTPGMKIVPIVAITSNVFPGARERCLVAGCDGYIPKPIDVDMFVATIEGYLKGQREDLSLETRAHYLSEYSRDLASSLEEQAYARQMLEGIVMQSPVSTMITDRNGVCVMHNSVHAALFNMDDKSCVGEYRILDDPQILSSGCIDKVRKVYAGQGPAQFQITYGIPETGERTLRFSMFSVLDSAGKVKNVVIQHMDETEEVQALEEQERLRKQLFQAQKMESIGTLAGGVAHDFNNLLVGVLGGAELLLKNIDTNDSGYKLLSIIRDSALKMSDLTKSLLAYAQGGKFVAERVDINHFIKETLKFAERVTDRQIRLDADLAQDLPMIAADRGQLHQVLVNIIMNGAEAITGRGRVSISTRLVRSLPEDLGESENREGPFIRICVTDTGSGMSEDVLSRIFEPFFSTKGTGRGLGLAATYGIATQHKAVVAAESSPGEGTAMSLYWPVAKGPAGEAEAGHPGVSGDRDVMNVKSGKVLVVDDEEVVRDVASDILSGRGYSVLTAADGDEGIRMLRANPDISLVLLDIIMKRMSGKETFPELKKIKPELKVLVSSGYDEDGPVGEIMGLGADGFIQKPYNMDELLYRVKSLLDRTG